MRIYINIDQTVTFYIGKPNTIYAYLVLEYSVGKKLYKIASASDLQNTSVIISEGIRNNNGKLLQGVYLQIESKDFFNQFIKEQHSNG